MTNLSSLERPKLTKKLQEKIFDILIIGGGITGAGIALDAKQRGLHVGLVEMQDFAAGTSSRSTKLVHGGLRYLKQFEVGLVAEVGKERAIVYENAPHVTTPEWMMLPFYKGGTFGPLSTNIGLRIYDFLAGVKRQERRKMLGSQEALQKEPLLQPKGLKGAGYYVEYKTDDARLTLEVLKKSVELGANALNYVKVIQLLYDENGKVNGVEAEDQLTKQCYKIFAKKVINATGPWVDQIRELDGSKQGKTLQLTKGIHLVFSQDIFPLKQAIYFDTADKRMIFAIPRDGKTYVGTTDTIYEAEIGHPAVTVEDRDYLLKAINDMFPTLQITSQSIESSWAGVRPLISEGGGKNPSEISRKDEIFISESSLYSMAGGKLTGYRKMAEEVMDKIVTDFREEGILFYASSTKHLTLSGGDVGASKEFETFKKEKIAEGKAIGLVKDEASQLVTTYGSNVDKVYQLFTKHEEEAEEKQIDPIVLATLIYAIEEELACTPADFFIRRTAAMFFNISWVKENGEAAVSYMAEQFGWSNEEKESHQNVLTSAIFEAELKEIGE